MARKEIDALGVIGGNLVLEEAKGFDPTDDSNSSTGNLEEMVELPDLEKAKEFRRRTLIWDVLEDGSTVPYNVIRMDTSIFGKYGVGLELYFSLLRELTIAFFIISCISIWPVVENYYGDGLTDGEGASFLDRMTVANQEGVDNYDASLTLQEANDLTDTIEDNLIRIAIADFLYCFVFLAFIIHYYILSHRITKRNFKENVTAGDYALQIKGIPPEYKDPIKVHEHFKQFGEIAEISLARTYKNLLDDYVKRANLSFKLAYEERRKDKLEAKNDRKIKKLKLAIIKFDAKIAEHETAKLRHEELPVNRAFILFNNLKERKLCLRTYTRHKGIFRWRAPVELKLDGVHKLKVRETTEPSNVHWENLEVSHKSRIIRRIISTFVTIIILLISVAIIFYLKTIQDDIPTEEECNAAGVLDVDIATAQTLYTTTDQIYCYCKQKSLSELLDESEINDFCSDYIDANTEATLIRVAGSIGVVIINFLLKFVLRKLSIFERMSTKTQEQLKIMNKVFLAMFVNTAIITLIVNADFSDTEITDYLPEYIFNGDFNDFSRSWYTKVGATITLTMLINVFSPHFITIFVKGPLGFIKRKCCWKRYKTQHELNLAFSGAEFDLSTKISQILNVVFTSFLYSGGIPLLNISCFLTLLFIFWSDKYLLLRFYKRPPLYSSRMNDKVVGMLPLAVMLHAMFCVYLYGAESIFPTGFHLDGTVISPDNESLGERIRRPAGIMFIVIFSLSIVLYIWEVPFAMWFYHKFKKNKIYSENKKGQGTYQEEVQRITEFGIHSFNILENKTYRPLVLSLEAAANKIKSNEDTNHQLKVENLP